MEVCAITHTPQQTQHCVTLNNNLVTLNVPLLCIRGFNYIHHLGLATTKSQEIHNDIFTFVNVIQVFHPSFYEHYLLFIFQDQLASSFSYHNIQI